MSIKPWCKHLHYFKLAPFKCKILPKECLLSIPSMRAIVLSDGTVQFFSNFLLTICFESKSNLGRTHNGCSSENFQAKRIKLNLMPNLAVYFVQQYFLRVFKVSQSDLNEKPRKRLRVPPNSATSDEIG